MWVDFFSLSLVPLCSTRLYFHTSHHTVPFLLQLPGSFDPCAWISRGTEPPHPGVPEVDDTVLRLRNGRGKNMNSTPGNRDKSTYLCSTLLPCVGGMQRTHTHTHTVSDGLGVYVCNGESESDSEKKKVSFSTLLPSAIRTDRDSRIICRASRYLFELRL